ncbi:hypothetical protein B4147_3250 [Bacillus wiedmannii]|uniref:Uncharacterized protein n=1 Tax=Bacillus wiedmannii TaxID=1890302 RepID=A0A0G8C689_9BACI|nr:hypothetical protein B4147_3250 [Bacillus wiedmannii]
MFAILNSGQLIRKRSSKQKLTAWQVLQKVIGERLPCHL